MLSKPKSRNIAVLLTLVSIFTPLSGLHKFYLGQPRWGLLYLLLGWTLVPKIASGIEGIWYLMQSQQDFDQNFNVAALSSTASATLIDPAHIGAIADAVRQLDQLRQDGLISEYEFEQKRRQLLDQIG
jgi:TM2 domain-containing membrane protein YozV